MVRERPQSYSVWMETKQRWASMPNCAGKAAAPSFLLEKETCSCTNGCRNRRCAYVKAGVPCNYCTCKECKNKIPANITEEHDVESSELEEEDVITSDMTDSGSESDADYVVSSTETE